MKRNHKLFNALTALTAAVLLCLSLAGCGGGNVPWNLKDQDTLTVNAVTDKTFGDAPFTLTATGGSGTGAVTFSRVSGTAAVVAEDGTVTIVSAGEVTVTAKKAADAEYKETEAAPVTVTIVKKTVTAPYYDAQHFYEGDALPELHTGGGTAVFDAGQAIVEGTHSYTWTLTPDGTDNYIWPALTGSLEITAEAVPDGYWLDTAILLRLGKPSAISLADWNDYRLYKFVPNESGFYKITCDGSLYAGGIINARDYLYICSGSGEGYLLAAKLTAGETYYIDFYTGNAEGESCTICLSAFAPAEGNLPETAFPLILGETPAVNFPQNSKETQIFYCFTPETSGLYTVTGEGQNLYFNTMNLYENYEGYIQGVNYNLTQTNTSFTGVMAFTAGVTYYFGFSSNYGRTQSLQLTFTYTPA